MKCPHCKEPNLVLSERQGIEIDYCPECRGIWLDRGELDKILEKSNAPNATENRDASYQQPPPQNYNPNYNPKYYNRKKSFLEEIFD